MFHHMLEVGTHTYFIISSFHRTFTKSQVLGDMGDDLVDAVKEAAKNPSTLSTASSYQRARENCRKEVQDKTWRNMVKLHKTA